MKINFFFHLSIGFLVVCASHLYADDIILKNGKTIAGKIVTQTKDTVIVETEGKKITFSKKEISRVKFKSAGQERTDKDKAGKERVERENAEKELARQKLAREKAAKEQAEKEKVSLEKKSKEQVKEEKRLAKEREQQERKKLLKEREARKKAEQELEEKEDAAKVIAPSLPNYPLSQAKNKLASEQLLWEQMHGDWLHKERGAKGKYQVSSLYGTLFRSAIIPGWGQYHEGRKIKGSVYFFGSLALVGLYANRLSQFNSLQSSQAAKENMFVLMPSGPFDIFLYQQVAQAHADTERSANEIKNVSMGLAVIYLVNLVDAWYFHGSRAVAAGQGNPLYKSGISSNVYRSTLGSRQENNFSIEYTLRF